MEEALHELVDAAVERGGEQHALPHARGGGEDAGDPREEAEVGHVVGLIQNRDRDGVQTDLALGHEVLQASGGGHDDVDAATQLGHLTVLADASEDGHHGQAGGGGQGFDRVDDLVGEFACGCQDETARTLGRAASGQCVT